MAQLAFPRAQVWGEVAATGRSDAAYARRFFARHADRGSIIGSPGTDLIWAGGRLVDAWPANPDENLYTRVQDSDVDTLLIGGRRLRDPAAESHARTPAPPGERPPGRPADIGHSNDFWAYQPGAGDRLINTYFDTGRVDTSLYKRTSLDFTPSVSHGTIAKILLARHAHLRGADRALAALAAAAGASPRRLRAEEPGCAALALCRRARARRLVPGALVVLRLHSRPCRSTTSCSPLSRSVCPSDSAIYFAWVRSGWSTQTQATGFAGAMGGALVGAWLGFHAIEGPLRRGHHDRRSDHRREPAAARFGHGLGSAAA